MQSLKYKLDLENYLTNPHLCENCNIPIPFAKGQTLAQVKIKRFCTQKCSAIVNNHKFPKRIKIERPKKTLISKETIGQRTKGDLFLKRKNWQSARSAIRQHAALVYQRSNKPRYCQECKYDRNFDICHIKSVSSFPPETLISEINHPDNLIGLCPNHHWEFDQGILKI